MYKILDLLIEVFNKGGDAKLDVAVAANRTPELIRMSPYVTNVFDLCVPLCVCGFQCALLYCENWHVRDL